MYKYLPIILLILIPLKSFSSENVTFLSKFNEAQKLGKTTVIHSTNKYCSTCSKQKKVLELAKKDFPEVIFLTYDQDNKFIANFLQVEYWSTILVYKNGKENVKRLGVTSKNVIYSLIRRNL